MVEYMGRHDERLANLEESQRAMQAYFVKNSLTQKSCFPLKTVEEVIKFAEEREFDELIAR